MEGYQVSQLQPLPYSMIQHEKTPNKNTQYNKLHIIYHSHQTNPQAWGALITSQSTPHKVMAPQAWGVSQNLPMDGFSRGVWGVPTPQVWVNIPQKMSTPPENVEKMSERSHSWFI